MNRLPLVSLLASLLACSLRAADESPILRPASERPVQSEVKSLPPAPHAISRETAEKLAAAVPKAPIAEPKPTTSAEALDWRDIDKPRNGIIRLPSFIVGELKLRVPTVEQEVLTAKGRLDLALKNHPGLKFGPFAYLNNPIALDMLGEKGRLQRLTKITELSGFLDFAQQPPSDEIKRQIQQTYLRTSDWLAMGGPYLLSRER